jgi:hypothetical protein
MRTRRFFPEWLNIWVLLASLGLGFISLCLVVSLLTLTRQDTPAAQATAILEVISAPTAVPNPTSSSPGAELTPQSSLPPSPPPGSIAVGAYVQVTGTGGDGLRLRIEPSLAGNILMLGSEAEVFRVHDGPREADGYVWWYLVGPFDSSRYGWAVSNFLVVVQGP